MDPGLNNALREAIAEATGRPFSIASEKTPGGGCINDARLLSDGERAFFVKTNAEAAYEMFASEAGALEEILATDTIRVPRPVTLGKAAGRAYLVLEALAFGRPSADGWKNMGARLAALHATTRESFGWHRDNTIGTTPQYNAPCADWPTFFRERRLRPQFDLARENGHSFARADELLDAVDSLLAGHEPAPSLLHGDLWSGNASFTKDGEPVLFDPATYYGDRETDLAFSEFFGGFPAEFYRAYEAAAPLDPGYATRKDLYNLYHLLNHTNLFGSPYARSTGTLIDQLLA